MKDVFSAFGSEVLRPLITLLLPGALAVAPIAVSRAWSSKTIRDLVIANRSESIAVLIMLMLFMGLICEDIGSHLEEKFDDRRDAKNHTHKDNWHNYLRIAFRVEPIGHHYLRTVLLRLKFELGSFVACGFALIGAWGLPVTWGTWFTISVVILFVAGFFLYEAWESHELLGDIRAEVLRGVTEVPPKMDGATSKIQTSSA